jgi:hypothetical protein
LRSAAYFRRWPLETAEAGRLKAIKGLGPALQAKIFAKHRNRKQWRRPDAPACAALLLENAEKTLRAAHPELT